MNNLYLLDKGIRIVTSALIGLYIAIYLGEEDFGVLSYLLLPILLSSSISKMNFESYQFRDISINKKLIKYPVSANLLNITIFLVIFFFYSQVTNIEFMLLGCGISILIVYSNIFESQLLYHEKTNQLARILIIENIIFSVFRLCLIYFNSGYESFFYTFCLEIFVIFLIIFYLKKKNLSMHEISLSSKKKVLELLLSSSAASINYRGPMLLAPLVSTNPVFLGNVALASRIFEAVTSFSNSFVNSAIKKVINTFNKNDSVIKHKFLWISSYIIFCYLFINTIILQVFQDNFVEAFFSLKVIIYFLSIQWLFLCLDRLIIINDLPLYIVFRQAIHFFLFFISLKLISDKIFLTYIITFMASFVIIMFRKDLKKYINFLIKA